MAQFVDVYSKATGRKHRVPAHFMDNPVLAKPFRKTPKTRAVEAEASATPGTDVVTAATDTTETPANRDKE